MMRWNERPIRRSEWRFIVSPVDHRKPKPAPKRHDACLDNSRLKTLAWSKRSSAADLAHPSADRDLAPRDTDGASSGSDQLSGKPARASEVERSASTSGAVHPALRTTPHGELLELPGPRYIVAKEVRRICGNIAEMTLYRWQKDKSLYFPQPTLVYGRRYWSEADVLAWWARRSAQANEGSK